MDSPCTLRSSRNRRVHREGQFGGRTQRWVAKLIAKAETAARKPLAGRIVPEMARSDVREVFVRTYRIVYRVREDGIVVLTVFEGHRLFPRGRLDPSP